LIVSAIAGLFIGGKRWEAAKADRARAQVLALQEKVPALEFQLKQMRRAEA